MPNSRPTPVDRAAPFNADEMLFSSTDPQGRIVTCNEVFLRISGFEPGEMLGSPHNIVRHPDMPKAVFRLFWRFLKAGRPIGAYVKNIAKNGTYYWVFALAIPMEDGSFLSIRIKPTSEHLEIVQQLYSELIVEEQSLGGRGDEAMDAAEAMMMSRLEGLGFASYEKFMVDSLRREIRSRDEEMGGGADAPPKSIFMASGRELDVQSEIRRWFEELDALVELRDMAKAEAVFLGAVGQIIRRVALNSSVCASRLEERGRALAVLSEQSARIANQIQGESEVLFEKQELLSESLETTAFEVSFARLAAEMCACAERDSGSGASSDEERSRFGATREELVATLRTASRQAVRSISVEQKTLRASLAEYDSVVRRFGQILLTTRINRITGRSMAAGIEGGEPFSYLLDEMAESAEKARVRREALQKRGESVKTILSGWRPTVVESALQPPEPLTT